MPKIFLSYRREDTAGYAGRIAERLGQVFGKENIFQDLEDIDPGDNYVKKIHRSIASCDVLIALIGPRWISSLDSSGKRRLEDAGDLVRIEVASAINKGVQVIPVLVQGAKAPRAGELPDVLKPLAERQVLELSDTRWDYDFGQLLAVLRGNAQSSSPVATWRWLIPVVLAMVATGLGWLNFQTTPLGTLNNKVTSADVRVEKGPIDVSGRWLGEWAEPQGKVIRLHFNFEARGRTLMGSVSYPTGEGGIHDGKISGDQLSFITRHTPQFEDRDVSISFLGTLRGEEIEFIMQQPAGVKRFYAKRTPEPDRKR